MANRLLLTVIIIIVLVVVYRLVSGYNLRKRARQGLGLDPFQVGRPAILYFTTPECLPCRTIQRPELEVVKVRFGEMIQIIEIDALSQPELADRWGVLSVPTTFIIDGRGRPRRVNNGIARAEKLIEQITEFSTAIAIVRDDKEQIQEPLQEQRM